LGRCGYTLHRSGWPNKRQNVRSRSFRLQINNLKTEKHDNIFEISLRLRCTYHMYSMISQ
jgi:hypothetical protein